MSGRLNSFMNQNIAYISVGSNLGRKMENCRLGIIAITSCGDAALVARSPFYRTEPVDYTDQDWFINAVFSIKTRLSPHELLKRLQVIQRGAGREESPVRFGPRVLDLDILLFGDLIVSTPNLVVPHPRMHKRRFVLQPLCDINPYLIHPVIKQKMVDLLSRLDESNQRVVIIND